MFIFICGCLISFATGLAVLRKIRNTSTDNNQTVSPEATALTPAPLETERFINNESTLLHDKAHQGTADEVEALVVTGADVNARDRFGCTPLYLAAITNRTDIINIRKRR